MVQRLLLIALGGLLWCSALNADDLVIVADPWLPFNGTPEDSHPGYLIEIAKAVFEPLGTHVIYRNLNWARAVDEARQGKVDAIAGAFFTDAPDFVFPKESFGIIKNHFYVKQGNPWRFKGFESLEKQSLGVINGYSYGSVDNYVTQNKNNFQRVQMVSGDNALEQNIKKLIAGRIDTFIEVESVIHFFLKNKREFTQIEDAGSLPGIEVFIAFSPALTQSKARAEALSQGIRELRKNGKLKSILKAYELTDWK